MLLSHINNPIEFVLLAAAFFISLTVHEFAHALTADRLGDPTPRLMGRLTLNPRAHLDPLGTLMILFAPFGWAKPVPFDPFNLKNPRRDAALISLAGPMSNLFLACLVALILYLLAPIGISSIAQAALVYMVVININLMMFNLIPIHPLDGFHIVEGFLSDTAARQWHSLQGLGLPMMLILVFPLFGSSPVLNVIQPITTAILMVLLPR